MATTIETSPRSVHLSHPLALTYQKEENHYGISTCGCFTHTQQIDTPMVEKLTRLDWPEGNTLDKMIAPQPPW